MLDYEAHNAKVALDLNKAQQRIAKLEAALAALLEDTQHSEHICPDDDCPVRLAKAALKESDDG
jgi:hypothetical protein